MMPPPSPPEGIQEPVLVTAREHLEEVVEDMRREPQLAIDTESNGFYAYQEKVCLLQISSAKEDFIVDPIAISDISALGELTADPRIEKIFHAGEYDLLCLKRDCGFRFANLFDTMIAGRLLGCKELGLAAAIARHFGVTLSKKLQRADWGKRPLSEAQVRYAQLDTHYLIPLSDIMKTLIREKGREHDASEAFAQLARVESVRKDFDPEGFWRLAKRDQLSGPQLSCLREIYLFRERHAKSQDRAPFRIMPEDLMARLAARMPADLQGLSQVRGMTPYLMRRFGAALLEALARGRAADPLTEAPRPSGRRSSSKERNLFEALRQWRKAQAMREEVEPVVILSTVELRGLARRAAAGEPDPLYDLTELKRKRYGDALLKLLGS